MKFFAIHIFGSHCWIDSTEASDASQAEEELARNNTYIILDEKEARQIANQILEALDKGRETFECVCAECKNSKD